MYIYCIWTQYLVGAPFALITASIRRGMEEISLWHCWGGMKPRFLWQWPSAHLHFLVSCFSFSSWQYLIDYLWTTGQQSSSSSLSPGKTPLMTTVAKFLDTSVCGALDALTPVSVHSLWSSPKFSNRFCLTILIRLRFSRLVVHLFLPHFFLPLNFLLTCLDTALCEQLLW